MLTFDQVIVEVEKQICRAYRERDRMGFFLCVYLHVITQFKALYDGNKFQDRDAFQRASSRVSERYLAVFEKPTRPLIGRVWEMALKLAISGRPTCIQQIFMSANPHLNFDLGISIGESMTPSQLTGFRGDFLVGTGAIKDVIEELFTDLGKIWPEIGILDRLLGKDKDRLVGWGADIAYAYAWEIAEEVSGSSGNDRLGAIARAEARAELWSRGIRKPPLILARLLLLWLRMRQLMGTRRIMELLLTHHVKRTDIIEVCRASLESEHVVAGTPTDKIRVAVLGGGAGAMTAVCELTDPKNPLHDRYDITVYQLGWRLGGKGASGRNLDPAYGHRIEEHGLHIWFGFYDNAFRMIRRVYDQLKRPAGSPLATWDEAFKPASWVVLKEYRNGRWGDWPGELPTNTATPGDGGMLPPWDYVIMAIQALAEIFDSSDYSEAENTPEDKPLRDELGRMLNNLGRHIKEMTGNEGRRLIHGALALARHLRKREVGEFLPGFGLIDDVFDKVENAGRKALLEMLELFVRFVWWRMRHTVDTNDKDRWIWIRLNCIYGCLHGCLENKVLEKGLDSLNHMDFRQFLKKYVYPDNDLTITSALVLSVYDGLFAYIDGDSTIPPGHKYAPKANIEAGTTLRGAIRAGFMTRGATMWRMQAGMGDAIFGPMYELLSRRGVKFRFFHNVREIKASADTKRIESIVIGRQATIKPGPGGSTREYSPLFDVKGLPCWPSEPFYDQLVEGANIKAGGINLENFHSGWNDVETITLQAGRDFDISILGISLGALPYICCDLIKKNKKWKAMVDNVKTIRTEALQLWLKPDIAELGWPHKGEVIVSGYDYDAPDPMDTWADLTHLIPHEDWPAHATPKNLAYYCAMLSDDKPLPSTPCGPMGDPASLDQAKGDAKVRVRVLDFLNKRMEPLFPKAVVHPPGGATHFNWDLLQDNRPGNPAGEARLDSQYVHANVQPSERYVLSVAGSTKHRLPPHDPAVYSNLYLAGDWIKNGFNTGAVESAVMGGMVAANAISGYPKRQDITAVDLL